MDIASVQKSTGQQLSSHGLGSSSRNNVSAEAPATARSNVESKPVKIAAVDKVDIGQIDSKRSEAMLQAMRQSFRSEFAVSDSSFTIYKDSLGRYITRVTSLKDGSVSYYPEPEMLRRMEVEGFNMENMVKVSA
jgi:hypothetical protein